MKGSKESRERRDPILAMVLSDLRFVVKVVLIYTTPSSWVYYRKKINYKYSFIVHLIGDEGYSGSTGKC